jgi:hypothetical protein
MLGKNCTKVFDHIFSHRLTLKFSGDHSLTPCILPEIFSCSPTLVFVAQNFLATNTRVSGLLEKISGNISVLWYIIQGGTKVSNIGCNFLI